MAGTSVMSHKFRVDFDGPEHGWLTVSLRSADQEYIFDAVHVPYDSVTGLVRALGTVVDGLPEALVRWTDGPIEYVFVFNQRDDRVSLKVSCLFDSGLAGRVRELVFEFEGSVYQVAHPLWKALRDLETRQNTEDYMQKWREEFPSREMEDLTYKMKALKERIAG